MKAFLGLLFFLLCLGVVAPALAQGNVVLLGLRSVEGDDGFANTLTKALREQARDIDAWDMSDRSVSLTQMSLAYGCEDFDAYCMSEISAGLKVRAVIYGTVQRTSTHDDYDYKVTMNIFNSETGSIDNTVTDLFPSTKLTLGDMAVKAKHLLLKLGRLGWNLGSILIRANVQSADVVIDGEAVGRVENSSLLLDGVQPGLHDIQLTSEGYRPFTDSVNVVAGEQSAVLGILRSEGSENASLLPYDDSRYEPDPSLQWLGWTLVGMSGVFVAGTIVSWVWIDSIERDPKFTDYRRRVGETNPTVKNVCAEADQGFAYAPPGTTAHDDFKDVSSMCNRADVLEVLQWIFVGSAIAAGGIGAGILISDSGPQRKQAKATAPAFVLEPRISPSASSVTATFRF